ncbi:hypothetical protein BU24DRAFT_461935 [Aaosphaeria arxii CBS 175.79]|uniref:Uncharacterized protein n=1 Tax=Aaosphaeria arxii CBS 175.79 TaxID=1450172 RepID=A0A6A5XSG4_9PLEO|nr:uncharacterized protein BU24DRAFT_461935 [Aaosphaeria arxii CBS 175.79]KAF2015701.1 hypothetical protein BU24DRAFT_461935 [Aaosphaeria arxii CBS 175.79]
MKVYEENTDRSAEVHLFAAGTIKHLPEYGEYVDPFDGAIGCYVPVKIGDQIKVGGRFDGTTKAMHHDVLVDGIYRKSQEYAGKSFIVQKNKKLDTPKYLYKIEDGILDTDLVVRKLPPGFEPRKHEPPCLGTIEVRICVLRRPGEEHTLYDVTTYEDIMNEGFTGKAPAGSLECSPDCRMGFEMNVTPLDNATANRLRKKMTVKRPGLETWAVFRFHYRSQVSIRESGFDLTLHADMRKSERPEPRKLLIESVPVPDISKPGGSEVDVNSTRQSSPAPSIASHRTPALPPSNASAKDTTHSLSSPISPNSHSTYDIEELNRKFGLRTLPLSKPTSTHKMDVPQDKVSDLGEHHQNDMTKPTKQTLDEESITGHVLTKKPSEMSLTGFTDPDPNHTDDSTADDMLPSTLTAPTVSMLTTPEAKRLSTPTIAGPPKRTQTLSPPGSPDPKRPRQSHELPPPTYLSSVLASTTRSGSPSLSPAPSRSSVAAQQLAEARERLMASRAKRARAEDKRKQVDETLAPYLKRMEEEIEAVNKLAKEEEAAAEECELQLQESMELLQKFQSEEEEEVDADDE